MSRLPEIPAVSQHSLLDGVTLSSHDADGALAGFAKALAHPARVKILKFLLASDACMCGQICDVLPLAQSTVSQHLKVLKEAGLIVGEIDGPRVCYSPNRGLLEHFKRLVEEL